MVFVVTLVVFVPIYPFEPDFFRENPDRVLEGLVWVHNSFILNSIQKLQSSSGRTGWQLTCFEVIQWGHREFHGFHYIARKNSTVLFVRLRSSRTRSSTKYDVAFLVTPFPAKLVVVFVSHFF